jgi:ATP-dependent RNA helicase HelY
MTLDAFFEELPFAPDPFQNEAIAAVAAGESVVVTAPTGAGKTLIAEAAIRLAVAAGKRAFYTTPLKALSNQKYGDFRAIHGDETTGLLTGDNSINGDAPVVIMTTEVLRNMIYADPDAIAELGTVILDEVHYLQDPARGPVWEEVIIHLPQQVPVVCLSATVSNAAEFAAWVRERRGPTRLVIEEHRPVPLDSQYLVRDRYAAGELQAYPVFDRRGARPNPALAQRLRRSRGRKPRFVPPRRVEVAQYLGDSGMLPAIYFIFSRAGCDAAADAIRSAGIRFTTALEAEEIRKVAAARTAALDPDDLAVLGYPGWLADLEAGVAAHHAGLVPAFKEVVETLFAGGLIRLVFATETLSLGINMPARTVVLEGLSRFTGERHELLRPGDYTQLTGRAGRRGIDSAGTAFVLHSRHVPLDRVAAIAATGSHPLRSSFQASYNMVVNLVANYPRPQAEALLDASFAQFVVAGRRRELEAEAAAKEQEAAQAAERARCSRGDIWRYLEQQPEASQSHLAIMRRFVQSASAGDVLAIPGEKDDERWVLLARGYGTAPRILALSATGELRRMRPEDLPADSSVIGTMELPEPFRPRDPEYQSRVAAFLDAWRPESGTPPRLPGSSGGPGADPVAACPDLPDHRRWARRYRRAQRTAEKLRSRLGRIEGGMVRELQATLGLLDALGYASGWSLTSRGERLRMVYNESDLLVAEAVENDLFAGLGPAEVAALASAFVFEPRGDAEATEWPTARLQERGTALDRLATALRNAETERGLAPTRFPEHGFAAVAYYWASGIDLGDLFEDEAFAAGDFVRNCRQLLDLLRQLRDTYDVLQETAARAVRAVDRGVVAAGGVL